MNQPVSWNDTRILNTAHVVNPMPGLLPPIYSEFWDGLSLGLPPYTHLCSVNKSSIVLSVEPK